MHIVYHETYWNNQRCEFRPKCFSDITSLVGHKSLHRRCSTLRSLIVNSDYMQEEDICSPFSCEACLSSLPTNDVMNSKVGRLSRPCWPTKLSAWTVWMVSSVPCIYTTGCEWTLILHVGNQAKPNVMCWPMKRKKSKTYGFQEMKKRERHVVWLSDWIL